MCVHAQRCTGVTVFFPPLSLSLPSSSLSLPLSLPSSLSLSQDDPACLIKCLAVAGELFRDLKLTRLTPSLIGLVDSLVSFAYSIHLLYPSTTPDLPLFYPSSTPPLPLISSLSLSLSLCSCSLAFRMRILT